jgi:hypothetical protein
MGAFQLPVLGVLQQYYKRFCSYGGPILELGMNQRAFGKTGGISSDEQRVAHVGAAGHALALDSGPRFNVAWPLATWASVPWTGEGGSKLWSNCMML